MKINSKNNFKIIIFIIILITVVLGINIYKFNKIKNTPNQKNISIETTNWVNVNCPNFNMKLPNDWKGLSGNDGSVMSEDVSNCEGDIFGPENGNQSITGILYSPDNTDASSTNGDFLMTAIALQTRDFTDKYSKEEIKIGDNIFQKITVFSTTENSETTQNETTEFYMLNLKNNSGVLVFTGNGDNKIFLNILKTVKLH